MRVFAVMLCGFLWITLVASQTLSDQLLAKHEKKQVSLTMDVVDFPKGDQSYMAFTARVVRAQRGDQTILQPNALIRMSCYHCDESFELGDQFQVDAVLRRPRGSQSWGAFDFEKYALNQGLSATGYIKKVNLKIKQLDTNETLLSFVTFRKRLQKHLQKSAAEGAPLAILSALSIGDRSAFTSETWRILRATGLSHIVAISGLHIGLIFLIFRFLIRRILNLFYPIYLVIPAVYLESFLGLLCATVYAALAGFSVPTQRALIMLIVYCFSLFCPRKLSLIAILCLSIGIIMLIDPLAILGSSFWLSVTAVALIGLAQLTRKRSIVYLQWFLSLSMAPLVIGFYGEVSLIAPLMNFLVVPLVSFIVLPCLFLSLTLVEIVPWLGYWVLSLLSQGIHFFWELLLWLEATVPILSINLTVDKWSYIISLCCILAIVLWSVLPNKRFIVLIVLCAISFKPDKNVLNHGEFILTVLDVGQGLAAVIETPKGVAIFDAGNRYGESDSAQQTIIPYLQKLGVERLRSLVISHLDSDHIGGLNTLLQNYLFDQILISERVELDFNSDKNNHQIRCQQGNTWHESGVNFRILSPSIAINEKHLSRNNRSCVLLIESALGSVLLPGDIEREVEHQLVEKNGNQLSADVLVLAHHGSSTSSSPAFLQRVKPSIAIASSGYLSRHGHPHINVVSRVENLGAKLFNTATSGSVQIRFLKTGLQTIEYRAKRRRFWYATD